VCDQVVEHLPAEPPSAYRGRNLVAATCRQWVLGDLCADIVLPVSELVTNAILHAGTDIRLTISLTAQWIEVSVHDQHARPPIMRPVRLDLDTAPIEDDLPPYPRNPDLHFGDEGIASGRGLHIVDAVADEWGIAEFTSGKEVWFRVRTPSQWTPSQPCECAQATTTTPGGLRHHRSTTGTPLP
jgi:anti-sigma regulatory factor (Ser/Thr protein kinase)